MLVEASANLDVLDGQGLTPLRLAINSYAWLNEDNANGQTPLIKDLEIQFKGCMEVMLEAGAKTNIRDNDGRTALHYVAERGWLEICTMLVEAGANFDVLDSQGLTPSRLADREGYIEVFRFFSRRRRNSCDDVLIHKTDSHKASQQSPVI